ncbi:MAG: hypothetical protein R2825_05300 [Saprospiraceae bacterium]
MRSIAFSIIMTLMSINLFSQKNIWIGVDAGVNFDIYKINDEGGFISTKPIVAGQVGVNLEKEFSEIFSLGTGFLFKTYMEGNRYKNGSFFADSRAFNSLIIPAYIKIGQFFNNNLFKISATAGGNFVYNFDYWDDPNEWFGSSTFILNNGITVSDNYYGTANLKRYFFLLHAGGGIEFTIFKYCRLGFMIKRHFGFANVVEISKDYTTNGTPHPTASLISTGDFTSSTLQFFYPLCRKNQSID